MRKSSLIAAVLVLAGLAAYIYLVEIRGKEARETREEEGRRLLPGLTSDEVDWLLIEPAEGQEVRRLIYAQYGKMKKTQIPISSLINQLMAAAGE